MFYNKSGFSKEEAAMTIRSTGYCLLAAALLLLAGCGEAEHRHEIAYVPEVPPTCTETGLAGHWACKTCGETFSDENGEMPADPEVLEPFDHNFVREEVKRAACEAEGLALLTCLRCGEEEEEVLPATGHLFGSWECTSSPGCETPGEESRTCVYCSKAETRPLAPVGHTYGKDNVCIRCTEELLPSPGLAYAPITGEDGNLAGYSVSIGTSSATEIVIAPYYEGLPVLAVEKAGFQNSVITAFTAYATLEDVGEDAFRGCIFLAEISLPNGVKTVGEGAFFGCSSVTSLTLGSSLERIGSTSFFNLQSLKSIAVHEENACFSGEGGCLIERATGKLILGSAASTIPETVTEICDFAFYNNSGIQAAVIPQSVTRIGVGAFSGCTSLREFTYKGSAEAWEQVEKGASWRDHAAFTDVTFAG